jgi:hypothetical protein
MLQTLLKRTTGNARAVQEPKSYTHLMYSDLLTGRRLDRQSLAISDPANVLWMPEQYGNSAAKLFVYTSHHPGPLNKFLWR